MERDALNEEARAASVSSAPATSQSRRALKKNVARATLGVVVGLAIAEGAFWVRDRGAFPHINLYVEDGERGVRLRPGTERIRFSNNPVTHVRINSEGYRGPEWPPPSAAREEIIVVGDSQVLGLGVEEDETFSTALEASLGSGYLVRNLGVPTYGPPEYNAVVAEALTKRPAKTVVYVVNMANDLFEVGRPNRERHAVWDGWAVRKETAPSSVVHFPGRSLLYTQSHAFFALRGYLHKKESGAERGFASEGGWRDIGGAAEAARDEHASADAQSARLQALREAEIKYAEDKARLASAKLDRQIRYGDYGLPEAHVDYDNESAVTNATLLDASRLSPGDIVDESFGESSRPVRINADHIRRGALYRLALEKRAKEKAERQKDKETLGLFDQRDEADKKVTELRGAAAPKAIPLSPLTPALREVKATCDRLGARLFVVALPIDVQVSKDEWKKYAGEAVEMEPTKILNDDVVVAARSVGADGFDAFSTLAAAEPGAFLDGDLHMTPKGHKALGQAIAKELLTPKIATPEPGLPGDRSHMPQPDEWTPNTEISVRESDPAGCETKKVREWLGIFCRAKGGAKGVAVARGTEVLAGALPGEALLVAPVIAGQDLLATFVTFDGSVRDFVVKVPGEPAVAEIGFSKPVAKASADIPGPSARSDALCTCVKKLNAGRECSVASTTPSEECERTYGGDCSKMVACASGDPKAPPSCAPGEVAAFGAQRCVALCSTSHHLACKSGRCVPWRGGEVCVP